MLEPGLPLQKPLCYPKRSAERSESRIIYFCGFLLTNHDVGSINLLSLGQFNAKCPTSEPNIVCIVVSFID